MSSNVAEDRGKQAIIQNLLAGVKTKEFKCASNRLIVWAENPRTVMDEDALKLLEENIKALGGVQNRLWVFKAQDKPGFFYVISGQRRLTAGREQGLIEFPVKEYIGLSETAALALGLTSNTSRCDMNIIDEGASFLKLAMKGISLTKVATLVGKSDTYVKRAIAASSLPEKIRQVILKGQIPRGIIDLIICCGDENSQQELIDDFLDFVRKAEASGEKPPTVSDMKAHAIDRAEKSGSFLLTVSRGADRMLPPVLKNQHAKRKLPVITKEPGITLNDLLKGVAIVADALKKLESEDMQRKLNQEYVAHLVEDGFFRGGIKK